MVPQDFMQRAIALSREAIDTRAGHPYGAVVVRDGSIVAEGHNMECESVDPSRHGEVVAIANAAKTLNTTDLSGCELYTSCEPCNMCASLCWFSNIKKIYYAARESSTREFYSLNDLLEFNKLPFTQRSIPAVHVGEAEGEALKIMRSFFTGASSPQIIPASASLDPIMRRAIELSREAVVSGKGDPYGAVVVRNGSIVADGHNMIAADVDPSKHGEVVAIANAAKTLNTTDLTGCELYTSCEPCNMCASLCWLSNIKKIYYAARETSTREFYSMEALFEYNKLPIEQRSIPAENMLENDALAVMRDYYKSGCYELAVKGVVCYS